MKTSILLIAILACAHASAQVYKCEQSGKVAYSDAPCLGTQRMEVTPTEGMDSLSGSRRTGADVRAERYNRQMAKAFEPLLGETPEQRKLRHRRWNLPAEGKQTCHQLDTDLRTLERVELQVAGAERQQVQESLLQKRNTFRRLKC